MTAMYPVNSSNIHSIGYDEEAKELHVRFASGQTYAYEGVEKGIFDEMRQAESKMKYLNGKVKGTFNARKLS